MKPNMYKHQVDECIARAEKELRLYRKYGRTEFADHVQDRIDSLRRIREKAPAAVIGAKIL